MTLTILAPFAVSNIRLFRSPSPSPMPIMFRLAELGSCPMAMTVSATAKMMLALRSDRVRPRRLLKSPRVTAFERWGWLMGLDTQIAPVGVKSKRVVVINVLESKL